MTTDLEDRLRADLPRLADQLIAAADVGDFDHDRPTDIVVGTTGPSSARPGRRSPWVIGAAAALVVVMGLVAVVAGRRDVEPARPGDELVTSDPDADSGPEATETTELLMPGPAFTRTDDPLSISVSLYSGRPDPVFTPTATEEAQLLDLLGRLRSPDETAAPPPAPYLGFRGFVITGLAPEGEVGGRFRIEVWGTSVTVSGYDVGTSADRGTVTRSDPTDQLFELLLDLTEAHVDELAPDGASGPELLEALRDGAPG
jgi:hypothetical protein